MRNTPQAPQRSSSANSTNSNIRASHYNPPPTPTKLKRKSLLDGRAGSQPGKSRAYSNPFLQNTYNAGGISKAFDSTPATSSAAAAQNNSNLNTVPQEELHAYNHNNSLAHFVTLEKPAADLNAHAISYHAAFSKSHPPFTSNVSRRNFNPTLLSFSLGSAAVRPSDSAANAQKKQDSTTSSELPSLDSSTVAKRHFNPTFLSFSLRSAAVCPSDSAANAQKKQDSTTSSELSSLDSSTVAERQSLEATQASKAPSQDISNYLENGYKEIESIAELGDYNSGFWCANAKGEKFLVKLPMLDECGQTNYQKIIKEYVGLKALKELLRIQGSNTIVPEVHLYKNNSTNHAAIYIKEVTNFQDYIIQNKANFRNPSLFDLNPDFIAEIVLTRSILSEDDWGPNNNGTTSKNAQSVMIDMDRAFHYKFANLEDFKKKVDAIFTDTYAKFKTNGSLSLGYTENFVALEQRFTRIKNSLDFIKNNVHSSLKEVSNSLGLGVLAYSPFNYDERKRKIVSTNSLSRRHASSIDFSDASSSRSSSTPSIKTSSSLSIQLAGDESSDTGSDMSLDDSTSTSSFILPATQMPAFGLLIPEFSAMDKPYIEKTCAFANFSEIEKWIIGLIESNINIILEYIAELKISQKQYVFPNDEDDSSPRNYRAKSPHVSSNSFNFGLPQLNRCSSSNATFSSSSELNSSVSSSTSFGSTLLNSSLNSNTSFKLPQLEDGFHNLNSSTFQTSLGERFAPFRSSMSSNANLSPAADNALNPLTRTTCASFTTSVINSFSQSTNEKTR